MDIYIIIHSENEAFGMPIIYKVECAHATYEGAKGKLEKISYDIENRQSKYFPVDEEPPKRHKYVGDREGYTYKWRGDDNILYLSHFYIKKIKLED